MENNTMDYLNYKEIVRTLPKPEPYQIDNFIEMVSMDHSWYKHLSIRRDTPFVFVLNPNAGRKLLNVKRNDLNRELDCFEFDVDERNRYQERFSHWQYFTKEYTVTNMPNLHGDNRESGNFIGLRIVNDLGIAMSIPKEVIKRGTFLMSRYLHGLMYEQGDNYFDDPTLPNISWTKKHDDLINELRVHLLTLTDLIYQK